MKNISRFKAFERFLWYVAFFFGTFVFVILFCRFFLVAPGRIDGPSMEPNFLNENLFFVNKFYYFFNEPDRFDVVQIIEPENQKLIIKRIIGLPGETVVIKRGKVFIGEETILNESKYLDENVFTKSVNIQRYKLSDNEYFVLGDNRPRSIDSRFFGSIGREKIIGKIITFN